MMEKNWPRPGYMDGLRPLTPEEIKAKWEQNREESVLAGSWMRLQCEYVLNGGCIEGICKEMNLFRRFLGSVPPLLAYRTEWCVWASQERVAGTIDFAARAADGSLVFLALPKQPFLCSKIVSGKLEGFMFVATCLIFSFLVYRVAFAPVSYIAQRFCAEAI